jgi:glucosamine--fructose-6-phosphate aminotransferase (isomerizing)
MCGIVGYIGKNINLESGLNALKRLEYRGYDSAGAAWFNNDQKKIFCIKKVGRIKDLEEEINKSDLPKAGNAFIFHTRWASHGGITEANTHPHCDCNKNIFLAHNGIVENYRILKEKLSQEGHKFYSETDTEVIAHLIEKFFKGNLEEAVMSALKLIEGTYALIVISSQDSGKIVAARKSSPLLIGVGDNENILASDASAVIGRTKKVVYLDDGEVAVLTPDDFEIFNLDNIKKDKVVDEIDWDLEEAQKGGYEHFMLKEIMEEPEAISNAIMGRLIPDEGNVKLGGLDVTEDKLRDIEKIFLVGCGTGGFAGQIGRYMIEEYAGIPCEFDIASELRYRKPILNQNTTAIFVSQSGETADNLATLKEFKNKGLLTLGITNVVGSSQARETNAGVYTRSGPEIAVASTKALIGQLATLSLFTVYFGRQREMSLVMGKRIVSELSELPSLAERILQSSQEIRKLAEKYMKYDNFFFIGRKYNYPIALEGALKLKEVSYLHAEGVAGGELKHGPLALIDENIPTVAICPSDSVYEKMISNIQEIKARKGLVLAIATEGNEDIKKIVDDVIFIPKTLEMLTPILATIPLHLFAYHIADLLGRDVDKPKNLAKSVTIE